MPFCCRYKEGVVFVVQRKPITREFRICPSHGQIMSNGTPLECDRWPKLLTIEQSCHVASEDILPKLPLCLPRSLGQADWAMCSRPSTMVVSGLCGPRQGLLSAHCSSGAIQFGPESQLGLFSLPPSVRFLTGLLPFTPLEPLWQHCSQRSCSVALLNLTILCPTCVMRSDSLCWAPSAAVW